MFTLARGLKHVRWIPHTFEMYFGELYEASRNRAEKINGSEISNKILKFIDLGVAALT